MNLKDKLLKYLSFALVFLSPLVFWPDRLYPHISSKTFFVYGVIEILFFMWIYASIIDRSYRIPKKVLTWFLPMGIFVSWMTITSIFGANFSMSFWSSFARGTGLLTLYHCFALSFVTVSLVRKFGYEYIQSFLQWFIAGATLLALSVWIGPGGLGFVIKTFNSGQEGGFMGNSSLAAVYSIFALAFSCLLLFRKDFSQERKKRLIFAICIIIFSPLFINISGLFNGYGILGSARASVVALPVMIGFFFASFFAFSERKKYKILGILAIGIGIITFSIFWISLINPNTMIHTKFTEVARGSRFIFWDSAKQAMHEKPLLGYGLENYSIAFQENFNPNILLTQNSMEGWVDKAHNIYYELGVSGGIPAIILYTLFLLSIFYGIYLLKTEVSITRLEASVLIALIIGYVFQNLFVFDSLQSLLAFFILSSLIIARIDSNDSIPNTIVTRFTDSDKKIIIFFLFLLFLACLILFSYMPAHKSKMYAETFRSLVADSIKDYSKLTTGVDIGNSSDVSGVAYDAYRLYVENAKEIKNNKLLRQLALKNLDPLLKYLYIIADSNKTDYRLYMTIVYLENTQIYFSEKQYVPEEKERLLTLLEKAQSLSPNNPNVYWNIAQVKLWSGDFVGAEDAYKQAMIIAPSLPGSYTLYMTYAQALGNTKLFDEIKIQAQKNIPGFKL